MRYSNLHTHTTFSDGVNTIEENVLSAIDKNFISIGISDHSYTAFDTRYCIRPVNIPAYHREIRRVAEKYKDQIEVYVGLEYDGYTELEDRDLYDYVIGDCHYIKVDGSYHSVDHDKDEQWDTIEKYFNGDTLAYAKKYFETYVERQQLHKPDILGHFDIPVLYGYMEEDNPIYRNMATEALIASLEVTPILELNNGAIAKKRRTEPYPHTFLLKEALAHGAKVVLSSDAHKVENQCFHFDESLQLLSSLGYKEIVIYRNHQFEEVGIV